MEKIIKIGTRQSPLAQWQARKVEGILNSRGYKTELVLIKSDGDIDLQSPLYELGVQGVFTRHLDMAVLKGTVDIAVHSMKDVPTTLAVGLCPIAVLERGAVKDVLLYKTSTDFLDDPDSMATIATGSIRRKAQWLRKYPNSKVVGLRGNVNTRIKKLQENEWDGALFAAAGLERIHLRPEKSTELNWMLPAPAQGAILVVGKKGDGEIQEIRTFLNDQDGELTTKIERDFLRALGGGCSMPIGCLTEVRGGTIYLKGNVLTPDGKKIAAIEKEALIEEAQELGTLAGKALLKKGGEEIMNLLVP